MARWPKEQPSTWYSQYKRGSLVSGHGAVCLRLGLARLCMGLIAPSAAPALALWPNCSTATTARRGPAPPATLTRVHCSREQLNGWLSLRVEDTKLAFRAPAGCRQELRPETPGVEGLFC